MAFYDNSDVDQFVSQLQTKKSEDQYMKDAAKGVGSMLKADPMAYKSFGPYWWAIKEMLIKYFPGAVWFKGSESDTIVKQRNWHGTLFRTVVAGLYYHGQQIEHKSECSYEHDGIQKPYTLIDNDAGM